MKYYTLLLTILFSATSSFAQNKDEEAVKKLLADQTKAWNKGDINEFMKGYWQSDSLQFIGKLGPQYGYKTTLENYKKNYPDTTAMGKLDFEILSTKRLSVLYFFVTGKWHLQRTTNDLQGFFTLIIKKIKNNWLIVADHSS